MAESLKSIVLILLAGLITASSFYRYNIVLYGHSIVIAAVFLLCAIGLLLAGRYALTRALRTFALEESVYLILLLILILLIIPLPTSWIAWLSPDAAGIRSLWTPNSQLSTISLFPYRMFEPILGFIATFFIFIVSYLLSDGRNRNYFVAIIILVSLIQGSLAIYSAFTQVQFIDVSLFDGHFKHGRGTFVNKNIFAAFMWFPLCFATANIWEILAINNKDRGRKSRFGALALWYLLLFFSVCAITATRSAGALAVGIILVITVVFTRNLSPVAFLRKFHLPILICFVIGVAILVFQPGSEFWYESKFEARATTWAKTPDLLRHYWLLGIGGNGISEMFDIVNNWSIFEYRMNTIHTYILDQWLQYGGIYVLGIAFLWYRIYRHHIAARRLLPWDSVSIEDRVFIRFVVLLGFCLLLHSVISPVFYYIAVRYSFIALLAIACKVAKDRRIKSSRSTFRVSV